MGNLLTGVHIALQALLSHQQAIEIIEHNVANASTEGYHRQVAVLKAQPAYQQSGFQMKNGVGTMGSGVAVDHIQRYTSEFYDRRYRTEVAQAKYYDLQSELLSQVEVSLNETEDGGLLVELDTFWTNWRSLAADPSDTSLRTQVVEQGKALAQAFNQRASQLVTLRQDQNTAITQRVAEVNGLADQIAGLNAQISAVISTGDRPNDLLDQRDLALDRLAELTGAVSYEQQNGEVIVSIGGHSLVMGQKTQALTCGPRAGDPALVDVFWQDGQQLATGTGEIAGLMAARDGMIVTQLAGLDAIASVVVGQVNAVHRTGYGSDGVTGRDFFYGSSAATIRLSDTMQGAACVAVAGAANLPGDGSVALQLANIQNEALFASGKPVPGAVDTVGQCYTNQVTGLGIAIQRASRTASDRKALSEATEAMRTAQTGVSLDEEAASLVSSQRAYQAAARLMNVIDEMLDLIINGLGQAGR